MPSTKECTSLFSIPVYFWFQTFRTYSTKQKCYIEWVYILKIDKNKIVSAFLYRLHLLFASLFSLHHSLCVSGVWVGAFFSPVFCLFIRVVPAHKYISILPGGESSLLSQIYIEIFLNVFLWLSLAIVPNCLFCVQYDLIHSKRQEKKYRYAVYHLVWLNWVFGFPYFRFCFDRSVYHNSKWSPPKHT